MKVKHAGNVTDQHFSLQAGVNKLAKSVGCGVKISFAVF